MNDFYYEELTNASFKELLGFASWMNRFFGHYPTIVGGWAVWCYTRGLGSRDIDVVFMDAPSRDNALAQYFFYNGYEETGTFLQKTYVKRIETNRGMEEIIIDACTASDKRVINGLKIILPWKWAIDYSKKYNLMENVYIYIPIPELLLTYKIGAVLGRTEALKTMRETDYARAKLWKDLYDVASLVKLKIELKKLHSFFDKSGIDKHTEEFLDIIQAREDILDAFKLKKGAIRKKIRP
jgi:hypothetical protein